MDVNEEPGDTLEVSQGPDRPFSVGDLVRLRGRSMRVHQRVPTSITDSQDLWPDPYSRSGWLSIPTNKMDPEDVALIVEQHENSYKVITAKGHIGWLETWDIEKAE